MSYNCNKCGSPLTAEQSYVFSLQENMQRLKFTPGRHVEDFAALKQLIVFGEPFCAKCLEVAGYDLRQAEYLKPLSVWCLTVEQRQSYLLNKISPSGGQKDKVCLLCNLDLQYYWHTVPQIMDADSPFAPYAGQPLCTHCQVIFAHAQIPLTGVFDKFVLEDKGENVCPHCGLRLSQTAGWLDKRVKSNAANPLSQWGGQRFCPEALEFLTKNGQKVFYPKTPEQLLQDFLAEIENMKAPPEACLLCGTDTVSHQRVPVARIADSNGVNPLWKPYVNRMVCVKCERQFEPFVQLNKPNQKKTSSLKKVEPKRPSLAELAKKGGVVDIASALKKKDKKK